MNDQEINSLARECGLLNIELDERHRLLLKIAFATGFVKGKEAAAAKIEWRINGPFWANLIRGEDDERNQHAELHPENQPVSS